MRGVWTALITPFSSSGEIDWAAFERLLQDQKDAGISGVIPCGTTGEAPTLSADEKKQLIERAVRFMKGSKTKVFAGTGTNSTSETVTGSRWAADQGVDGILVVTPYYNKPSAAGLEAHFRSVADAVSCELMLYNVPGRTGISLTAETISSLAAHPKIRSLKEATGNVAFTSEILDLVESQGRKIDILGGDDATYLPLLSVGGVGVVSVASNLFPRAMVAIQTAFDTGKVQEAISLQKKFYPLFRDLFVESNPVPVKAAMHLAGWCEPYVRAPLAPFSESGRKKLEASLKRCEIASGRKPL